MMSLEHIDLWRYNMEDNRIYKLNLVEIKKDFKFKPEDKIVQGAYNLKHKHCDKIKILPYTTKKENIVLLFDGVIGAFLRMVCNKKLKSTFVVEEFIDNVTEEIGEFEDEDTRKSFRNIIQTMFINNDKLIDFDIKTINYIEASTYDESIAEFLFSLFMDDELKILINKLYNKETNNILKRLVLNALPDLEDSEIKIKDYKCYIPFIKELFRKDFMFLMSNEELYKNSIQRFLEYYNMFYISQLSMKLSQFEKADLNSPDPLYYTLNWESTSKNRTAYRFGFEKIKKSICTLYSHAITLEMLNYHNLNKQLGYVEIFELIKTDNNITIKDDIRNLIKEYKEQIGDIKWEEEKVIERKYNNEIFDMIYKLYDAINFQFIKSKGNRNDLYNNYKNWAVKFIEKNFGKARGSLGYNLNLTEEDIILLTKICINTNQKLKVSVLFKEFEKRGIWFDRDSQTRIIQLYEKLNLLEKKSDSGDAQYVKSVL